MMIIIIIFFNFLIFVLLSKIIVVTWKDKVSNAEVLARTGQRRLQDIVGERRFRFAGHVMRMAPERPARGAIE